jgi:hypothetical protein
MNTQLVNSLVQIIESLTPEERTLLFERLSSKSIQVTAGVCGGQPRIRNTRIPVWTGSPVLMGISSTYRI